MGDAAHLITPMLATAIFSPFDEIVGGARERIIRFAEGRDAAVMIIVDAHVKPNLGHPLGVPHGACPRAAHLLGRTPAAIDDDEGVEQLLLPIAAPARLAPSKRTERRDHR